MNIGAAKCRITGNAAGGNSDVNDVINNVDLRRRYSYNYHLERRASSAPRFEHERAASAQVSVDRSYGAFQVVSKSDSLSNLSSSCGLNGVLFCTFLN